MTFRILDQNNNTSNSNHFPPKIQYDIKHSKSLFDKNKTINNILSSEVENMNIINEKEEKDDKKEEEEIEYHNKYNIQDLSEMVETNIFSQNQVRQNTRRYKKFSKIKRTQPTPKVIAENKLNSVFNSVINIPVLSSSKPNSSSDQDKNNLCENNSSDQDKNNLSENKSSDHDKNNLSENNSSHQDKNINSIGSIYDTNSIHSTPELVYKESALNYNKTKNINLNENQESQIQKIVDLVSNNLRDKINDTIDKQLNQLTTKLEDKINDTIDKKLNQLTTKLEDKINDTIDKKLNELTTNLEHKINDTIDKQLNELTTKFISIDNIDYLVDIIELKHQQKVKIDSTQKVKLISNSGIKNKSKNMDDMNQFKKMLLLSE
jgi:hypothetical protein